jgi:S-adenosylmethionine/arginine decarboxylase-like enzyme
MNMMCNISHIENIDAVNSIEKIEQILTIVCEYNNLIIKDKIINEDDGIFIIYMLKNSYLSLKTCPDIHSLLFDIALFQHDDEDSLILIYDFILLAFQANATLSTMKIVNA